MVTFLVLYNKDFNKNISRKGLYCICLSLFPHGIKVLCCRIKADNFVSLKDRYSSLTFGPNSVRGGVFLQNAFKDKNDYPNSIKEQSHKHSTFCKWCKLLIAL